MLPTKFQASWPWVQEKKRKIKFQDGCHLGFLIRRILAIFDLPVASMLPTKFRVSRWHPSRILAFVFDLQVTQMPLTKFQVSWPFVSGEVKNRFSRWRPSLISDFSYFLSTNHPDASYQVFSQLAQGCRRSKFLNKLLSLNARQTMDIDQSQ